MFLGLSFIANVGLETSILVKGYDDIVSREGVELHGTVDGDASVGHDEHQRGAGGDAVVIIDFQSSAFHTDSRVFHVESVNPLQAFLIVFTVRNLHEIHVMLVATHDAVCLGHERHDRWVEVVGEEEVDEDSLSSVEDFKQVVFMALNVDDGKINGFLQWSDLRMETRTKEQEADEDD